jgi:hypothetical protein
MGLDLLFLFRITSVTLSEWLVPSIYCDLHCLYFRVLLLLFNDAVSRPYSVNVKMISKRSIGKDLEGSGPVLIKLLF